MTTGTSDGVGVPVARRWTTGAADAEGVACAIGCDRGESVVDVLVVDVGVWRLAGCSGVTTGGPGAGRTCDDLGEGADRTGVTTGISACRLLVGVEAGSSAKGRGSIAGGGVWLACAAPCGVEESLAGSVFVVGVSDTDRDRVEGVRPLASGTLAWVEERGEAGPESAIAGGWPRWRVLSPRRCGGGVGDG
ncbi:MAG: hypothetical protein ACKOBJ_07920, partial [Actinomycetota bacterium]